MTAITKDTVFQPGDKIVSYSLNIGFRLLEWDGGVKMWYAHQVIPCLFPVWVTEEFLRQAVGFELERLEEYKVRQRSWSQLSTYEQCPHAYYLERIAGAWQRPAAWFATGTAVHKAIELWEIYRYNIEGALEVAQNAYRADVAERLEDTPNPDAWQASGRYKGAEDIPRRFQALRSHLENYEAMLPKLPPLRVGESLEVPLSITLDGVEVIGFADQIREDVMVDIKAGSVIPKDPSQMKLYALANEAAGGEPTPKAAFVMTAKKRVIEFDLTTISEQSIVDRVRKMDDGVKAEEFNPTPGDQCKRCSVLTSCPTGQRYTREAR